MRTRQVNVRMSEALIADLDSIAKELHVTKTEWMKLKLAEAVYEEKKKSGRRA
jgi:hypothetical protein